MKDQILLCCLLVVVCSQQLSDIQMFTVTADSPLLPRIQCLRVYDLQSSTVFMFDCPLIDNLMLDRHGIVHIEVGSVDINLCRDCYVTLANAKSDKIPHCAWANSLYQGNLPPFFGPNLGGGKGVCQILHHCACYLIVSVQ